MNHAIFGILVVLSLWRWISYFVPMKIMLFIHRILIVIDQPLDIKIRADGKHKCGLYSHFTPRKPMFQYELP